MLKEPSPGVRPLCYSYPLCYSHPAGSYSLLFWSALLFSSAWAHILCYSYPAGSYFQFITISSSQSVTNRNIQELCLTNEFGTLRPRKCDNKFCAFCKKSTKKFVKEERWGFEHFRFYAIKAVLSRTDPKPILLKGLCKTATEEDFIFDTEFYPSGMQDGRIYFR